MYPRISVMARVNGFSVEIHPEEDVGAWETWYNGNDPKEGLLWINAALRQYPDFPLFVDGYGEVPLKGYLFTVRTDAGIEKFFKAHEDIRNPFYNRKVYQNATPGSTVSFMPINM